MVAPFNNPFRPGAGQLPPYLAGRLDEQNDVLKILNEKPVLSNVIITGLRGVGKTVLLETLKPLAINNGWLWAGTDLSETASVCGLYSEGDKTWVVDIDDTGSDYNEMLLLIDSLQPEGGKLVTIVQTKNGLHLITKPFNLQDFRAVYPDIDVHKNNPTVLYIP
jgi:hypothetical protein